MNVRAMKYKKNIKRVRTHPSKLIIWLISIVALGAVTGVSIMMFHRHHSPATNKKQPIFTPTSTGQPVNLSPPTNQEKQQVDQTKDQITKDQASQPSAPSSNPQTTASPFITYAAQQGQSIQVNGYVGGVFEDNGTCLATFTKGDLKVTGESKGIADSDHTTCPPITIPRSSFSSGTWSVVLSYSSDTASGSSQARNVVIQ